MSKLEELKVEQRGAIKERAAINKIYTDKIKELQNEEKERTNPLNIYIAELDAQIGALLSPFQVGDILEGKQWSSSPTIRVVVNKISTRYIDDFCVHGTRLLKTGEIGVTQISLSPYDIRQCGWKKIGIWRDGKAEFETAKKETA